MATVLLAMLIWHFLYCRALRPGCATGLSSTWPSSSLQPPHLSQVSSTFLSFTFKCFITQIVAITANTDFPVLLVCTSLAFKSFFLEIYIKKKKKIQNVEKLLDVVHACFMFVSCAKLSEICIPIKLSTKCLFFTVFINDFLIFNW